MADRQVDPSRLQGEALRRWYLRSPDDIAQQRQAAAALRYDDFFGITRRTDPNPGFRPEIENPASNPGLGLASRSEAPRQDVEPGFAWAQVGPNRWSSRPASSSSGFHPNDSLQLGDANDHQTGMRLAASGSFCAACHSSGLPPPPPVLANPPDWPRWTPGPDLTPRKPAKPHPAQCAMQNMRDSRICSREPGDAWKSVCLQSASDREAHCIATDGEVGWPPLETHDRR